MGYRVADFCPVILIKRISQPASGTPREGFQPAGIHIMPEVSPAEPDTTPFAFLRNRMALAQAIRVMAACLATYLLIACWACGRDNGRSLRF
jgi:hypothetical protein